MGNQLWGGVTVPGWHSSAPLQTGKWGGSGVYRAADAQVCSFLLPLVHRKVPGPNIAARCGSRFPSWEPSASIESSQESFWCIKGVDACKKKAQNGAKIEQAWPVQPWHGPCWPSGCSRHRWVFWETRVIGFMPQKVRAPETGLGFAIRTQTPFAASWVLVSLLTGETQG